MCGGAGVTIGTVRTVLTGRAVPYARPGVSSAIAKRERTGSVDVDTEGLEGDEQGDRRVHGGPDKAVHLYAYEHYASWIAELGRLPVLTTPGAFGENLSTDGILEGDVCLGDRIRVGTALLEVAQARQPCWKLNHRFGVGDMSRRVQDTARTGWYCRVLRPGRISAGETLDLVDRPHADWPLSRLLDLLYRRAPDDDDLHGALQLPLVPSWRRLIERRIETKRIEDWRSRLYGEA